MPGVKTNERPGTRAVLRHYRMSATKARQVLDLVRGREVDRAHEILRATPREGARVVAKVLESAVSNARNNEGLDPDELYVSACYADEGVTVKRFRPRARGRATRVRKRTCHITVIVSVLPEDRLARRRSRQAASSTALRSRRVAASRREEAAEAAAHEEAEESYEDLEGEEFEDTDLAESGLDTEDEADAEDELADDEEGAEDAEAEPATDGDVEAELDAAPVAGDTAQDAEEDAEEAEEPEEQAAEEPVAEAPAKGRRRLGRSRKAAKAGTEADDTADDTEDAGDGAEESD